MGVMDTSQDLGGLVWWLLLVGVVLLAMGGK